MTSLIFIALAFPSWLPDDLKDPAQYQLTSQDRTAFRFRRLSDESRILIRTHVPNRLLDYKGEDQVVFMPSDTGSKPPSGLPLGVVSQLSLEPGAPSVTLVAGTKCEVVMIDIQSERKKIDGKWFTKPRATDQDGIQLESWARTILSRLAGQRLQVLVNVQISGVDVPSSRSVFAGATLIDLEGWAKAKGARVEYSKDKQTASLSWKGVDYLLPLASQQCRITGKWVLMKDVVVERAGRWFVPIDSLPQ